nr:MAG TPA: NinB protein [Bacteriophage sp.]
MQCRGKITQISRDILTRRLLVTMVLTDVSEQAVQTISAFDDLSVEMKKYRAKRSLDANAYFHVLVGKIADTMTISKAKAKNMLICRYGQPQLLPDGSIMIYKTNAPEEFMWEQEAVHAIPVRYEDKATFYKIYRGSHTYDTKEMSLLIDGTVADAKELGIETLPPTELARMKERWGV